MPGKLFCSTANITFLVTHCAQLLGYSICATCCIFIPAPSVKSQEKQRLLTVQNTKDVAQYDKENISLELEMAHYCNFEAFLQTKASARINEDIDYSKGDRLSLNALSTK